MRVLYDAPGRICRISVTESDTTRYLELDGCEEGAMALHSEDPVFYYLWFHKCSILAGHRRRVLVLGAGAFTAAKCLALDYPKAQVDAVDVEPELGTIGRQFFHLDRPAFARIAFHGVPAEDFLVASPPPYDFIFDDLFDGFQHVPCSSRAGVHFAQLAAILSEGGVCIKNVIWNPLTADTRAACEEAYTALRSVFPFHTLLPLGEPARGHNQILIGMKDKPPFAWSELRTRLMAAGVPPAACGLA